MTRPSILSIGTAVPRNRYDQAYICDNLMPALNSRRAPAVFRATDIEARHSVVDDLDWLVANPGNGERLGAYITRALPLGVAAIERALEQVQLLPAEVDHLIVASCTGVDTPGLDVKISETMGMSPYLRRATLVGMGCQALLPSLYQASNIVQLQPASTVVVLTLELCTLHFQHGRTLKNMLGSALFGDGASAAVVGTSNGVASSGAIKNRVGKGAEPQPQLLDTLTYSDYQTQEEMAFHPGDNGYQIVLSGRIPALVGSQIPPLIDQLLTRNDLVRNHISHWVVHPGGMKILDEVEAGLDLENGTLDVSRDVLRQYGNMSSATLLFVLRELMSQRRPQPGDYGVLVGLGPGVTIELGLLRW